MDEAGEKREPGDVNVGAEGRPEGGVPPRAPSRWKRLLQNLALACGTFVLCGVILEIILHLAGYGNLEIYQPDPVLYWKLKPNQHCFTKVGHQPVRVNSLGTRGPEFSINKPGSTLRILSLGDSRTFGWGVAEAETYSGRLEQSLNPGDGRRVEVINAGVNAWSYAQMFVYFREIGLRYQPDFLLIGEANQWTQFSEQNSPEFVKKFMWRVRLKNLLRRSATYHYVVELKLKDFYERYRTRFIPVNPRKDELFKEQQQSEPNAFFEKSVYALCTLALTNGVRPVLVFLPTEDEIPVTNTPALLEVKQRVARQLGVPLVDMRKAAQTGGNGLYLEGDPVHFSSRGNELIAREIVDSLMPLVRRE